MRLFHELVCDPYRNDVAFIEKYEVPNLDCTTMFWQGSHLKNTVSVSILEKITLYVNKVNLILPDYFANPLSWPICSQRMVDILTLRDSGSIEVFEAPLIDSKSGDKIQGYWLINVTNLIDCVDTKQSSLRYSKLDPERILVVKDLVISEAKVPINLHIFRMKRLECSVIFSDELANDFIGKNLVGLGFITHRGL